MKLPAPGVKALISILATCGGTVGPMYRAAQLVNEAKKGMLEDIVPLEAFPVLAEISKIGSVLSPQIVLEYFSAPAHYQKIASEGTTAGRELEDAVQPLAHLLLPLTNGRYQNGEIEINLDGLIPIGKEGGQQFAHLAGTFWSEVEPEVVQEILRAQHQLLSGRNLPKKIDYHQAPKLQAETKKAKEELGL